MGRPIANKEVGILSDWVHFRLAKNQRNTISQAAKIVKMPISQFIRNTAIEQANHILQKEEKATSKSK